MADRAILYFSTIAVAELMLPHSLDGELWMARSTFLPFHLCASSLAKENKLPSLGPETDGTVESLPSGKAGHQRLMGQWSPSPLEKQDPRD